MPKLPRPTIPDDRYCPKCDKMFRRPIELQRHLTMTVRHKGNSARCHPCHLCGKTFTQKSNIPEHIRSAHGFDALTPEQQRKKFRGTTTEERQGNYLARKDIGHRTLPPLRLILTPTSSQDWSLELRPIRDSTMANIPFELTNSKDKQKISNDPYPMPAAVPSAFPYNFASPGSTSSTSTMSASTLSNSMTTPPILLPSMTSPSNVLDATEVEEDVTAYFAELGLHSTTPVSFAPLRASGVQYPSFSPQSFNNSNGSVVSDQSGAYHVPSSVPSTNNEQLMKLKNGAYERKNFLAFFYGQPYQQASQCYQPPQYNHLGDGMGTLTDYPTNCNGITQLPEQQYPQEFQWPTNVHDGLPHLSTDASY